MVHRVGRLKKKKKEIKFPSPGWRERAIVNYALIPRVKGEAFSGFSRFLFVSHFLSLSLDSLLLPTFITFAASRAQQARSFGVIASKIRDWCMCVCVCARLRPPTPIVPSFT